MQACKQEKAHRTGVQGVLTHLLDFFLLELEVGQVTVVIVIIFVVIVIIILQILKAQPSWGMVVCFNVSRLQQTIGAAADCSRL